MKRRHLLALVILALVVATVVAVGPVRVWDWMTTKTVEEHWPNGSLRHRLRVRLWEDPVTPAVIEEAIRSLRQLARGWRPSSAPEQLPSFMQYEGWYRGGQKRAEFRRRNENGSYRLWSESGALRSYLVVSDDGSAKGVVSDWGDDITAQMRPIMDGADDKRTSPPWFTESEILRYAEGVEE